MSVEGTWRRASAEESEQRGGVEKGGNGITISRIDGGNRRLIPFFTVSAIRKAAPNLVSFVTWEDATNGQKNGFQLTWLLDTTTGEARPVTVGASPEWQ